MSPEEIVRCIDFRYLTDVLTPDQALEMLKDRNASKAERMQLAVENKAVPAYNTSAGWLGHDDQTVRNLLKQATDQGFKHFKLKVGLGLETDRKRLGLVREVVGEDGVLMVGLNGQSFYIWSGLLIAAIVSSLRLLRPTDVLVGLTLH
jgi:L-galactonate dehydratase